MPNIVIDEAAAAANGTMYSPVNSTSPSPEQQMSKFRTKIIEPLVQMWRDSTNSQVKKNIPHTDAIAATKSQNPSVECQSNTKVLAQLILRLPSTPLEYSAVQNDMILITSPLSQKIVDDVNECCEFLMTRDEHEFKNSSSWFRVNPHPREISAITDIGFKAYFGRQKQKDLDNEKGGAQKFISPICNIVAGYLKRNLALVSGGIITESMRKMICVLFSAEKPVSEPKMEVIRFLLNVNPQRRALLRMITLLANKILANDPVEASSLAVVIPVHNLNACGSITSEALLKRMSAQGTSKYHDAANALEMRALVGVFEEWNKILGYLFLHPELFF
ncbi:hypothetical protein BDR26DRAFT_861914, partial [Obelidium mucronatum]